MIEHKYDTQGNIVATINYSPDFHVAPEDIGVPCNVDACTEVVTEGQEWGEHWTSDDNGNYYCAAHDACNPTSDTFGQYDEVNGQVICPGCDQEVPTDNIDAEHGICEACIAY